MHLIADAFGGDHAPLEVLKGCRRAADKLGVRITLAGSGEKIRACAAQHKISLDAMEILEAPGVFSMEYEPQTILREHKDSSMAVGLRALADGGADAFLSAGSTGALMVGATLIVKRLKGVRRGGIGAVLPSATTPFLLLDSGANAECSAEMLVNFALLGTVYMQSVLGIANPRVALANIGTEPGKGDSLRQEAYPLLAGQPNINFIGNIESREIPFGGCDVVVADGFTGNMILKLYEGMGKMLSGKFKKVFTGSPLGLLGMPFALPGLMGLKKMMDYKEYGGAPILGLNGVVIKAHGSSDAKAFYSAIRQAKQCVEGNMVQKMKENLPRREA
ncbi:MAG: phosphate acyltransferase PlsX [Oscillospiraceae bacterium]|nr:phosphate acyltransferase PlsX [Oscillospiraceae bacterium]